ncbi:MAG: hypothetical protein ACK4Y4_01595, partial [Brevundimonas sp.]
TGAGVGGSVESITRSNAYIHNYPPTRGDFLRALGIETRAQRLIQSRPDAAPVIERQLHRLTGSNQMGDLFKAACVFAPRSLSIPGFEG